MFKLKKIVFQLCICTLGICAFSSCAHTVYPVESLRSNYELRMRSAEELEIKGKVLVYFNERDIKSEYSIVSVNVYKPFTILPINALFVKKMTKRFLAEAVKQAYKEGGNAILIKSAGYFYVLNLVDFNADDASAGTFSNPILNMKNAEKVKSGELSNMKRNERKRTEKTFMDEIKDNCDNITALEEIKVVRQKIEILSNYNLKLKHPKSSIEKLVKKATKKVNRAEKRINKNIAKQKQNAAKPKVKK